MEMMVVVMEGGGYGLKVCRTLIYMTFLSLCYVQEK
jgi:hypothetical protein